MATSRTSLARKFAAGAALVAALLVAAPSAMASDVSLVRDINPGGGSSYPLTSGPADEQSQLSTAADVGGELFFVASEPTHGTELWRSDGTTAGTTCSCATSSPAVTPGESAS